MLKTVLLAAALSCALACLSSVAEARPSNGRDFPGHQVGCSQPEMRPCGAVSRALKRRQRTFNGASGRLQRSGMSVRPRAWCGWWLGRHLGMTDRRLWRALEWRHVGRAAHGPAVGAVVVWARGKGRGHVGIITGKTARGWVVLSGNDGNAVRERVRSVAGAVAFRWP